MYVDNILAPGFIWNLKDGKESISFFSSLYSIFLIFSSLEILEFLFKFKFREELGASVRFLFLSGIRMLYLI